MMSQLSLNPQRVSEIPKGDSECEFVNSMLEMPIEIFRQICRDPISSMKSHGILPKWIVPTDYIYKKSFESNLKEEKCNIPRDDDLDTKDSILDQNQIEENRKMIENVSKDIELSPDNENDDEVDNSDIVNSISDKASVLKTLDLCYEKLPNYKQNLRDFKKYYKAPSQYISSDAVSTVELSQHTSCNGDTEPFEGNNSSIVSNKDNDRTKNISEKDKNKKHIENILDILRSTKPDIKKFPDYESLYVKINGKRKRSIHSLDVDDDVPSFRKRRSPPNQNGTIQSNNSRHRLFNIKNSLCFKFKLSKNALPQTSTVIENSNISTKPIIPSIQSHNLLKNPIKSVSSSSFRTNSNSISPSSSDSLASSGASQPDKGHNNKPNSCYNNTSIKAMNPTIIPKLRHTNLKSSTKSKTNERRIKSEFVKHELIENGIKNEKTDCDNFSDQLHNKNMYNSNNSKVNNTTVINDNKKKFEKNETTVIQKQVPTNFYERENSLCSNARIAAEMGEATAITGSNGLSNDLITDDSFIQGLKSIYHRKNCIKKDFISKIKLMDTKEFYQKALSYVSKANDVQNSLDYPPTIFMAIKQYLYYNYSLDIKDESKKCHQTYLENTDFVNKACLNIRKVYADHMSKIQDPSSPVYQNLHLIQWFTVTVCMRLMAILEYRAFRSIDQYCDSIRKWLKDRKILDKDDQISMGMLAAPSNETGVNTNVTSSTIISPALSSCSPLTNNNRIGQSNHSRQLISPFNNTNQNSSTTIDSPYNNHHNHQHTSIRSSGSHNTVANGNHVNSTNNCITGEAKLKLEKYCEMNNIINNAYKNWALAEKNRSTFFHKGQDHEDTWHSVSFKLIYKTGGIEINSIDESMPFVIKYIDGLIHFLNEFKDQLIPPQSQQ